MSFVQAKCENCGGTLAVDSSQKAAVCPFCNTPYVVQDAINNYNITNNVNVGAGAVVNVYGNANNDFVIEAGVLKEYHGESKKVIIPNTVDLISEECFDELPITEISISSEIDANNIVKILRRLNYLERFDINNKCVYTKNNKLYSITTNEVLFDIIDAGTDLGFLSMKCPYCGHFFKYDVALVFNAQDVQCTNCGKVITCFE